MKKHILALSISFALASNAFGAQMPEKLIIFGDSLSDNGNILRFTYNQENVYNEYLANYYGYSSPRHDGNFLIKRNQDGPNYALGGAVANDYLGGLQGALSPKLSDEINNYLSSRRKTQNQDYKYIFWIGGNDLRLADDDINLGDPNISTDQSQNKKIQGSIGAVETQLKKLLINGKAKFVIVPNAPNIANTPNFTNNFLSDGRIYFDGWKSLLGGRKFLGFGGINKNDVIRFLDDQNNHGRPAKDVIYDAFEFVLRKHYNIPQGKPLTSAAFQELQQWKRQFERVYKAETSLVNTFNQGVDKVIENLKAQHPDVTFIRPNIQLLLDEVMSHYTEFGFNNVSGSAANPFTSAVVGWGAGKGRVAAFEPIDGQKGVKDKNYLWGKGYQFVFADQFHPSPKTHRMIADYIMSLLESESGDPTDLTVRRVSTTPFNSTANNIYHSAEGDGVFHVDMHSNDINKSNLNIFNDGRALFASNGGKIQLTNTNITSQGRLGGIINAELGGKIYLTNGHIDIYRTNPYVAPFGVMVNGQSSEVELNKIKLNTFGKETTAITVGNKATLRLQDSQIKTNGVGANVLNLWDSRATIINSTLNTESEKASGVRVFANDQQRRVSTLAMNGSTITATTYYAIKVAENGTKNAAILNAVLDNSTINGGIFTANQSSNPFQHSQSHFVLSNNSLWNMTKDSNVTSMNLRDSTLDLSQSAENWQAKTLNVNDSFAAQNATIRLGTDLYDDSSATDKIQIHGNSLLNAALYIENRALSLGAETKAGIKIIDLNPNKENGGSLYLAKDVTAGLYQYMLTHGGIGADDQSDWYLTSSYIKQDDKVIPVVIAEPETTQPTPTMGKDRSVASTDLSVEAQSVTEPQPVTEDQPVVEDSAVDTAPTETNNMVANQPVVETQPVVANQPVAETQPVVANQLAAETQPEVANQPAAEVQPVVTNQPVVETQPEVATQPVVANQPVVEAQPVVANQPAAEVQPVVANQPVVEAQPEVANQPVVETQPVVTNQPVAEVQPVVANQPAVETQPVVTNQPVVEAQPEVANQPAVETQPVVANQPVVEAQPVVTNQPVVEAQPEVANQPAVETQPVVANQPVVEAQPVVTNQPVVANQPVVEDQPVVANQPAAKTQPVVANQPVAETQPVVEEQLTADQDSAKPRTRNRRNASGYIEDSANVAEETADNSSVATSSVTSDVPASQLQRILNNNATLLASLPYISQYLSELHLDYARRNPNAPLWDRQNHLDYWVNVAYAHNRVKGDHFLNLRQNSQILSIGKDVITTKNMVAGLSATYSKTQNSVDNYINCQLGLRCYSGKVTSEMASVNGYYLYNWDNWYAQAVMSVGRVTHKFKNADKEEYKQHGYIASAEQLLGYRYPMNSNWTVYADLGLQESYHHYSAMSVAQIAVDKISEHNINALMNIGTQYRIEKFAFSSNLRLVKNLRDFDRLTMDNTVILDKFAKDSAAISGNARYYFTNNISLFMNIEYLRSLNRNEKRQLNYQAGLNIQF
ncbi:SGNH/GDSL hydrolase family protein [Gallibacterium anatis]|uniref:SGNH/GDSL hydrolase family protein n=1 Tax=Gallibacterium anatis TaxID=750 RepID=UPI00254D087E|nr:SGNH/GDSL hydrolase family protein [Gallibacterium anatis]MDK9431082.1 SGNH/GDSL hydrolase family protein [Gallibacterium anatis]